MTKRANYWVAARLNFEREFFTTALRRCGGNIALTARYLGSDQPEMVSKRVKAFKIDLKKMQAMATTSPRFMAEEYCSSCGRDFTERTK